MQIYQEIVKMKFKEFINENPTKKEKDKAMRKANIYAVKNTNKTFLMQENKTT